MLGWPDPPIYDEERLWATIDALIEIAEARGCPVPQVALAYLLAKPGVASLVIGARTDEQLMENLPAAELTLTTEELSRLDDVSAPPLLYPYWWQAKYDERLGRRRSRVARQVPGRPGGGWPAPTAARLRGHPRVRRCRHERTELPIRRRGRGSSGLAPAAIRHLGARERREPGREILRVCRRRPGPSAAQPRLGDRVVPPDRAAERARHRRDRVGVAAEVGGELDPSSEVALGQRREGERRGNRLPRVARDRSLEPGETASRRSSYPDASSASATASAIRSRIGAPLVGCSMASASADRLRPWSLRGRSPAATAAAIAAAASWQKSTSPTWIRAASAYAWSAAARGSPALTSPTGQMHIAELLDGMLPAATRRGGNPHASLSAVCRTEGKNRSRIACMRSRWATHCSAHPSAPA